MIKKKTEPTPLVTELNNQFRLMVRSLSVQREHMREDMELYYSDVEGTRTQFTKDQLEAIREKYDIPISTKIAWAIVEQLVSFVTGGKPAPRLLVTTPGQEPFAEMYGKAMMAAWYEGDFNTLFTQAVRDCFAAGYGLVMVRPNDFYNETTFGVTGEYISWERFYVDPHSRKPDFSDAEYMCLVDVMPKSKAEKRYDITITEDDLLDFAPDIQWGIDLKTVPVLAGWPFEMPTSNTDKDRYVWIREFFSKQIVNVYLGDGGQVSTKKPKPVMIPNPDRPPLQQQIDQIRAQMQQSMPAAQGVAEGQAGALQDIENPMVPLGQGMAKANQTQREWDNVSSQMNQATAQLQQLEMELASMPEEISAYTMTTIGEQEATVRTYSRHSRKAIKRWLLVNDRVIEDQVIPCDEYPIVPFTFSVANRPDRVYGIMHYIKDISKALNKFWSLMIYDMQTSTFRKVFYPKGALVDPAKAEKDWARPMAFIEYNVNSDIPDGGRPFITEPGALSPAIEKVLGMLQNLLEYITGISSLMQGQATSATPDTFGGIQTMQTFGTQRVKLYSRWLEHSIERISYVLVSYLQAYAPKNKVLTYLDENGDQQEIELLESNEDIKFKVRVNMASSLPTTRAMSAQLMGILAGQTKDPHIQQLLTQYLIDYMDMPEGPKIKEEVDAVKNLSQQVEQMQGQMQELESKNSQLEQQIFQKNLEVEYAKKKAELEAEVKVQKARIDQNLPVNMPEQPTLENAAAAQQEEEMPPPF